MEREKEITKLYNVLLKASRMALQSEWTGENQNSASFCVKQYNRVLVRLKEIDPSVEIVFAPLPEGSSLTTVAIACGQLASYFEDEIVTSKRKGFPRGVCLDMGMFKDLWKTSEHDIRDLGEFIRENIEEWGRHRKDRTSHQQEEKADPPVGESN